MIVLPLRSNTPHVIVMKIFWNLFDPGKENKRVGSQQGFDEGKTDYSKPDEWKIRKVSAAV